MKKLIFTIWVIVGLVLIFNTNSYSQNQWFIQQNLTEDFNLNSVYFIDENTGWCVGNNGIIEQSGLLEKTTNGGRDWTTIQISSLDLLSVFFQNAHTGWIVGGNNTERTLLKSTDGGNIWISKSIPEGSMFSYILFINENTGWILGSQGALFKTTDAGNNWSNFSISTENALISAQFINSNTGWIVGNGKTVIKTTNGGNSWMDKSDGITGISLITSVNFIDNNVGWISGFNYILKTTNGGDNWETLNFYAPGVNWSVRFIDDITGWVVCAYGGIYKTSDGGNNWNSQISGTTQSLNYLFILGNSGWAVGRNGIILNTFITPKINDVSITNLIIPVSDTTYSVGCINNTIVNPVVKISNFGSANQNNFLDVHFEIKQGDNILYSSTKQDTISSGQSHTLSFDPYTIAFDFSTYNINQKSFSMRSWTSLLSDSNRTNDTVSSTFTVNNPNYGYSDISGYYFLNSSANAACIPDQPVFHWEDTTGSVNLITNGTLAVPYTDYNGFYSSGCFRLPDVLPDGNKFRFFGTCYDTIVIATNGIIGLGGSMTGMNIPFPVSIPSASAPRPAIFPFWYWCNFIDPEITGRNLKYKVTADKFIVTYDRVPIYNTIINSQDYLSYQVILETGPGGGTENGKITVQFDDSRSGSYFLNNYYNGNLNANTVGIQDASGTIGIQYRRSESPGNIPVPGPLFGSPMAIAFGQVNETLPVELALFNYYVKENEVTLNWQTSQETNNSGFNIERSANNDQWCNAGFIEGKGNTNSVTDYSFTDKNLVPGKYTYRLKQIDYNGSFEYFDLAGEVIIGVPDKYELSQNYPNPFNPVTNLEFAIPEQGSVTLKVYDVLGKEVKTLINEIKQAGRYRLEFDGSSFASGVYFYELRAGNFVSQKRMLLLK